MQKKTLESLNATVDFYEDRYNKSEYMHDWPHYKKERVKNIIRGLGLPETGSALDFGCGRGVFTDIIKQALPNWDVSGCDISETALKIASQNNPGCNFFVHDDKKGFDFLFTHHVLEHVYDLEQVMVEMDRYMKSNAKMLHILPSGNKGSFEYNYCKLIENGIQSASGNRFFFEDEGHLRRITTKEFTAMASVHGFELNHGLYSNQYYGAIQWIVREGMEFINDLTSPDKAVSNEARAEIVKTGRKLLRAAKFYYWAEYSIKAQFYLMFNSLKNFIKAWVFILFIIPLSALVSYYYKKMADIEWNREKENENGSEMYLFFKRNFRT